MLVIASTQVRALLQEGAAELGTKRRALEVLAKGVFGVRALSRHVIQDLVEGGCLTSPLGVLGAVLAQVHVGLLSG